MNFAYCLTENARRRPDHTALVDGERRLTYAELDHRVNGVAAHLRDAGVGRGAVVGALMWNCAEFFEVYFAAMRLGATFLPLNYRMSADELRYELIHSECRVLVAAPRFEQTVTEALDDDRSITLVTTAASAEAGWTPYPSADASTPRIADVAVAGDAPQRIMYTSGTTSRPKGVVITHDQVQFGTLARAADFGLTADDVGLAVGPLYHVAALDTFATVMLYLGGTLVICSKFDAAQTAAVIRREHVTNCWMAPAMVSMLLDEVGESAAPVDLRVLVMGGEKAPLPMLEKLFRLCPAVRVHDAYGLTECQGMATVLPSEYAVSKLGSVGIPARGREIRIVDDTGLDVPVDAIGEVLVRGPVVFPGYFNDPAATAAALTDGWLHTGDIGRFDSDGFLYIVDRKKDMIRSGGENIAASEVERVLFEIDGVADAAVVARPHEKWGQVPVAFVVADDATTFDAASAVAHCRQRLAGYKVPTDLEVVDSLPRTPSGKVLKRELRARFDTVRTA